MATSPSAPPRATHYADLNAPARTADSFAGARSRPGNTPAGGETTGDDFEEEAVATRFDGASHESHNGSEGASPPDDESAPWPSAAAESAMIGELTARGESPANADSETAASEEAAEGGRSLPDLDTLVGQLKPEIRATLDELFRARFYDVKRMRKRDLRKEP